MAKSVEIPQDIIDSIIAVVGDDTRLLKQCSLVSSSFLLPCRKQLFSRITLKNDEICQGIHQFLVQNPVIQSFIRTITLLYDRFYWHSSMNPGWMNGISLLAILRLPFNCLERFSISLQSTSWNWNSFSSELKDALSNVVYSSNLKTFSLERISKVPIAFFFPIVHLTTLELHSLLPSDFGDENINSPTQAASKGMAVAPMAVIDRCVWSLYGEDVHGGSKFLPFMCRLRFFKIYALLGGATRHDFRILSLLMGSLCMSLTSPATLEHLELIISFDCPGDNDFDHDAFYKDLRDADVWSHLDSITNHPTGSRFQRVDIKIINYAFRSDDYAREPDEDEVVEAVLDSLPLLHTKGILFVEAFPWVRPG